MIKDLSESIEKCMQHKASLLKEYEDLQGKDANKVTDNKQEASMKQVVDKSDSLAPFSSILKIMEGDFQQKKLGFQ